MKPNGDAFAVCNLVGSTSGTVTKANRRIENLRELYTGPDEVTDKRQLTKRGGVSVSEILRQRNGPKTVWNSRKGVWPYLLLQTEISNQSALIQAKSGLKIIQEWIGDDSKADSLKDGSLVECDLTITPFPGSRLLRLKL
jgi:hypothetical protein